MSKRSLVRIGSMAAIVAGALRMLSAFLVDVAGDDAQLLYLVIDLGLLSGLTTVYLSAHERLGIAGFIGFAIAFPAAAAIVGPDGVLYGLSVYQLGGGLLVLGMAVLAVAQLRTSLRRQISSAAWIAAFVAAIATTIPGAGTIVFTITGLAFGFAFLAAGVELWRESAASPVAPPAPASSATR